MAAKAGPNGAVISPDVLLQAATLKGDHPALLVEWHTRRILACNRYVERVFGHSPAELVGGSTQTLHATSEQFQRFGEVSEPLMLAGPSTYHGFLWMQRRSGEAFPSENLVQLIRDDAGQPFAGLSIVRDLTEGDAALGVTDDFASLDLDNLTEHMPGAVFQRILTAGGHVRYTFLAGELGRRYGLRPAEVREDPEALLQWLEPADRRLLAEEIKRSSQHLTPMDLELAFRTPGGNRQWVRAVAQPRRLSDGSTVWDGCALDITQEKEAEHRVHYLATHDPLTGLANRSQFLESLRRVMDTADAGGQRLVVAHVDLARMLSINESRGSAVGDDLLRQVAERLQQATQAQELVARSHGDVFQVMLVMGPGETELERAMDRLREVFDAPFDLSDGGRLDLNGRFGLAVYPEDADQPEPLVRASNIALTRAKAQPDQAYAFYAHGLSEAVQARFTREQELRAALEAGALVPYFQPQVALADGSLVGFEALARWPTEGGMVSPATFIPLAEETGLIGDLGEVILRGVLDQLSEWQAAALTPPPVGLNASAKELRQRDFAGGFRRAFNEVGVPPQWLGLEVTESSLLEDFETTRAGLEELAQMGISLAIDDFGTGFSSLSRLAHLPLDVLKIDRSFVWAIETDPRQRAIIEGLIPMAKALGLSVMAEGVETEAQADWLRRVGCDNAQGFLYAPPLPAAEARRWLARAD